jgi:iron complex outermembrane receptor protein
LQISQFDGSFGFNVANAKEAEVQGIEVDGRWALTDDFTLTYSYSWLDFEFTDFKNGNCYNRQVPDGETVNGLRLCNYNGETGQYAPRNSASLALDYNHSLSNGLALTGSVMYNYRSSQQIHDNHDPNMVIDGVGRINARIGVGNEHWDVALIGKNLTNEKVLTYAGNVPLSASTFGTNTFYGFVDRGRQLAVEGGYRF